MNYLACLVSSFLLLGMSYPNQANLVSLKSNLLQNHPKNSSLVVQQPPTTVVFPITGWNVWQNQTNQPTGIRVTSDTAREKIMINTNLATEPNVNKKAAGYVIESNEAIPGWGGKRLILTIGGTKNPHSQFDSQKLFKLEVNGNVIRTQSTSKQVLTAPDFVKAVDGQVEFQLPAQVTKMNFVFYNANLKNVTISGRLSS